MVVSVRRSRGTPFPSVCTAVRGSVDASGINDSPFSTLGFAFSFLCTFSLFQGLGVCSLILRIPVLVRRTTKHFSRARLVHERSDSPNVCSLKTEYHGLWVSGSVPDDTNMVIWAGKRMVPSSVRQPSSDQ
jgi:hypothetical protein